MPFAGYQDFSACVSANGDKGDPQAYCGYIKHRAEGGLLPRQGFKAPAWLRQAEHEAQSWLARQAASSLPYPHEVVDPNNADVPQADTFVTDSMFPLNPAFQGEWETGPGGAVPKGGQRKEAGMRLPGSAARMFGHLDALEGRGARHKKDFSSIFSDKAHGQYLRSWNATAGQVHAKAGKPAMTRDQYSEMTGRPDLHREYLNHYNSIQPQASLRSQADTLTRPHQTTDDYAPPYNSQATTPQPFPGENSGDGGDYQAGFSEGKEDAGNSVRPTFMDNSSRVSPYVKGYAEGYASVVPGPGGGSGFGHGGDADTPASVGGNSGQPMNAEEAATRFQVSKASLGVSAAFVTGDALADPDFAKGYRFARGWKGGRLVSTGSAAFEAGLYAGISDNPGKQDSWVRAHDRLGVRHAALSSRLDAHEEFTRKYARAHGSVLTRGLYVHAGTSTDLISDGPGSSPDPMGSTPLNGPGTPPSSGGRGDPARSGGPSPYQGAEPHGSGPVVSDDVAGQAQEGPKPDGPPAMGFSGPGPGYTNQNLAPRAPNSASGPGYSNAAADQGNPHHDRTAAFRARVQANLKRMKEMQRA